MLDAMMAIAAIVPALHGSLRSSDDEKRCNARAGRRVLGIRAGNRSASFIGDFISRDADAGARHARAAARRPGHASDGVDPKTLKRPPSPAAKAAKFRARPAMAPEGSLERDTPAAVSLRRVW